MNAPKLPTAEEAHAAVEKASAATFERMLQDPVLKLLISMIPASDTMPPELLRTLLQTFFKAGVSTGLTATMLEVANAIRLIVVPDDDFAGPM